MKLPVRKLISNPQKVLNDVVAWLGLGVRALFAAERDGVAWRPAAPSRPRRCSARAPAWPLREPATGRARTLPQSELAKGRLRAVAPAARPPRAPRRSRASGDQGNPGTAPKAPSRHRPRRGPGRRAQGPLCNQKIAERRTMGRRPSTAQARRRGPATDENNHKNEARDDWTGYLPVERGPAAKAGPGAWPKACSSARSSGPLQGRHVPPAPGAPHRPLALPRVSFPLSSAVRGAQSRSSQTGQAAPPVTAGACFTPS